MEMWLELAQWALIIGEALVIWRCVAHGKKHVVALDIYDNVIRRIAPMGLREAEERYNETLSKAVDL